MSIVPPETLYHRLHQPENGAASRGLPLVFLHGLMGFSANWGKIWPRFQDRQVLVYDQRGHGRSPKPATGYAPTDYAEDLKGLLDHLGWKKCHIVGHSMGGRVALRFCSLFPELAATLTMEDSGAAAFPERVQWIQNLLGSVPTPFHEREVAKKFFVSRFAHDPLTGSFLHANLETRPDGTLDWRFHAPGMIETVRTGRATDAMAEFASLRAPTLLLRGAESTEFPAEEAARMAAARKNVELVTVEGAGHYVHAEQPAKFSEALGEFIRRHD
jgi:pimeloyl-ACP methyl ester carboxylesterase